MNLRDRDGNTALHWAAITGNVALLKMLLEAGADPEAKNMVGVDAIHYAADEASRHILSEAREDVPLPEESQNEGQETVTQEEMSPLEILKNASVVGAVLWLASWLL